MLTVRRIKAEKPEKGKTKKLSAGGGLFLAILPSNRRVWRMAYRQNGKQKTTTFGDWPDMDLDAAVYEASKFRNQLKQGINPRAKVPTFAKVAEDWLNNRIRPDRSERHIQTVESRLNRDLLPTLGDNPINKIKSQDVLEALRPIEARSALEAANRTRGIASQIFRYAIAQGHIESDPAAHLKEVMRRPKSKHMAAPTSLYALADILLRIWAYPLSPPVAAAMRALPFTVVRPGELCRMRWGEIDWEKEVWLFNASKTNTDHSVAFTDPFYDQLQAMREYQANEPSPWVFCSPRDRDRHIAPNGLIVAMRRAGVTEDECSPHGFRAAFRTIAAEHLNAPEHLLEAQLAHTTSAPHGRAYDRASFEEQRAGILMEYAKLVLDACQTLREQSAFPSGRLATGGRYA